MESVQFSKKITGSAILLIISAMFLSACVESVPTGIPSDEEERIIAETVQAMATEIYSLLTPELTLTTEAPSPLPSTPTVTTLPNPTFSLPDAAKIRFTPDTTYGAVRGTIEPGKTQNFALDAQQGQPMLASVASTDNDVTMSIFAESGTMLLPVSQGWSNWQGTLPATQDYYIQIIGGASEEDYSLWISIPSRIEFAPGVIAATINGQTIDGNIASYVVAARGGQTMDIVLTPEPNIAALTVWGFNDGQPYIRAQTGSTSFDMQLPSTQDYIIDVVPQGGQEVNFTLKVEIK